MGKLSKQRTSIRNQGGEGGYYNRLEERWLLRKSWRTPDENEKEGLKALSEQIRGRLAMLQRPEQIQRSKKENERSRYFREGFRFWNCVREVAE